MTTTYLCGLCPLGNEYRSEDEDDVRKHVTKTTDSRHRGHSGSDPDTVIYRAGAERDGELTLSMPLSTAATSDEAEKRTIAALLEYPYLSLRKIGMIADTGNNVVRRVLDEYRRVALERERRALDYVRDDTRYHQTPDGEPRQPAVDDTERRIIKYALDNPDDDIADVKDALDLAMSVEDIREIVRTKTVCPKLPSEPDHRDAIVIGHRNPDMTAAEIAEEYDLSESAAADALYRLYTDEDTSAGESQKEGFPDTYLDIERVATMKLSEEEIIEDARKAGFDLHPPDERPRFMYRHLDTLLYLYYYRDHTFDEAGRICGATGQSVRTWLVRHGYHEAENDYEFSLDDLYHGYDEENDYEFTHLIPSSRDPDEDPEQVVREAGNVRYEGPELDTTTGREPQTIKERPTKPGVLPDNPDKDDWLDFLDHEEVTDFQLPNALHDPSAFISANSGASNATAGALVQIPSDRPINATPLIKAVSDIADYHVSSIRERLRDGFLKAGYVDIEEGDVESSIINISISDEQKATLRGDTLEEVGEIALWRCNCGSEFENEYKLHGHLGQCTAVDSKSEIEALTEADLEEEEAEEPATEIAAGQPLGEADSTPAPPASTEHASTGVGDAQVVERVGITPGSRAEDPPIDDVDHESPGGRPSEGRSQEIIAGQHPDDILTPEDYTTLVRLVAQDEGHSTGHDGLLQKLIRLGGVALEGENAE